MLLFGGERKKKTNNTGSAACQMCAVYRGRSARTYVGWDIGIGKRVAPPRMSD